MKNLKKPYYMGMTRGNPELMAVHLCLPITVWINLCDREPDREEEVLEMIERHIRQFLRYIGDRQSF